MAIMAQAFYPLTAQSRPMPGEGQDGAMLHPTARLGENVTIELGAMIGRHAEIGDNCVIGAGAMMP